MNEDDVKNFRSLFDYLKRFSENGSVTSLIEKQLLLQLDNSIPYFAHLVLVDRFPQIERLTINKNVVGSNRRLVEIAHLKYPPKEKVKKYGRCNFPGQSIFYGAFHGMTVMNELRPREGDLITFSTWVAKPDVTLKFSPVFKNQPPGEDIINPNTLEIEQIYERKLREHPEFLREPIDLLIQFIADAFTRRVNPDNHLDYVISAYYSNKIFNDFENGSIEAIYYPSVGERLSFENIAIKPEIFEKKYDLQKVKDCLVVGVPGPSHPGYMMEGLSECKNFDHVKSQILWDPNKITQPKERLLELKLQYDFEI